jgi:RNA polymerase sigma factor (TIGR02999 family)
MRTALIDHARSVNTTKRGGQLQVVPLHQETPWINAAGPDVVDLDRALDELAQLDSEQAQMFETRFVLGCTTEETAEMLEISVSTVERKVRLARAWLYQRLRSEGAPATS